MRLHAGAEMINLFCVRPSFIHRVSRSVVITLRPMTAADLGAVAGLLLRAFLPLQPRFSLPRSAFLQLCMDDAPAGAWVAEQGRELAGAVFGHNWGRIGWIGPLAVSPRHQRHGIGSRLYRVAVQGLNESGCAIIGLDAEDHVGITGFYQRLALPFSVGTLDGCKAVRPGSSDVDDLLIFSRSQEALFSDEWSALQRSLARPFDLLPYVQRLHQHGLGESAVVMQEGCAKALMILQTGPKLVNDRAAAARLQMCWHAPDMEKRAVFAAAERLLRARYPACRYLYVRTIEDASEWLVEGQCQVIRRGRRWATRTPEFLNDRYVWFWE